MKTQEVDILGTKYKVIFVENGKEAEQFPSLRSAWGVTLPMSKIILIQAYAKKDQYSEDEGGYIGNSIPFFRLNLRHEIIHAYLLESGLDSCSSSADAWAKNEEMIDWFATLSPKIFKTFEELEILD